MQLADRAWELLLQYMRNQSTYGHLPEQRSRNACGCILVDGQSFPQGRLSTWPKLKSNALWSAKAQPGRIINECTGNYIDIFTMTKQASKAANTPSIWRDSWGNGEIPYPQSTIFPLQPCMFDKHEMLCPNNATAYLALSYHNADVMIPDHFWNETTQTYVGPASAEGRRRAAEESRSTAAR